MKSSASKAEKKFRLKKKPKNLLRRVFISIIILYLLLVAYRTVQDLVIVHLADASPLQYGTVYSSVPVSGLLVRDEKVQTAPRNGKLKIVVPEGEKVRVGQTVAQVVAPSFDSSAGEVYYDIKASRSGLVSYYLDGLEEVLDPESLQELDIDKIKLSDHKPRQFQAGIQVNQGQPVLKIVNNLKPVYVVADMPRSPATAKLAQESSFPVALEEGDTDWLEARLVDPAFREGANRFLFSLNKVGGGLLIDRTREFHVIAERMEGYFVPASAIVRKEGADGVYTVYKERVRWKKVEIKGEIDGKAVISVDDPNMLVIMKPERVQEGDPFQT